MNDIVIIGAGIIGCSIARELSKYQLDITVIEKNLDVAEGTSKANSGIVHAGFTEKKNTLKGSLVAKSNKMFDILSDELEFSMVRNGALVLAYDDNDVRKIEQLKKNGEELGITGLSILDTEAVKRKQGNITKGVKAALYAETSAIVNPYDMTIAMAESAALNGVNFKFGANVVNIEKNGDIHTIYLENGEDIKSRFVINAAGLFGAEINNMMNEEKYNIRGVKGEYCLFDKIAGAAVKNTLFRVPGEKGKGVLVTPTTDGNLIVGPNSQKEQSVSTTREGIDEIIEKASKVIDDLPVKRVITSFSGVRAKTESGDFIIEALKDNEQFINVIGIDSPGLTCAPAIAEYVSDMISKNLIMIKKHNFISKRHKMVRFAELSVEDKNKLIKDNPEYGRIVCKCELITEGEIIDAIHRVPGAVTLDGVKRRTRAMMGGCQGMGCMLPICKIMSRELNVDISEINKNSAYSPAVGFREV